MFNIRQKPRSQDLSSGFWAGQLVTTQCENFRPYFARRAEEKLFGVTKPLDNALK